MSCVELYSVCTCSKPLIEKAQAVVSKSGGCRYSSSFFFFLQHDDLNVDGSRRFRLLRQ